MTSAQLGSAAPRTREPRPPPVATLGRGRRRVPRRLRPIPAMMAVDPSRTEGSMRARRGLSAWPTVPHTCIQYRRPGPGGARLGHTVGGGRRVVSGNSRLGRLCTETRRRHWPSPAGKQRLWSVAGGEGGGTGTPGWRRVPGAAPRPQRVVWEPCGTRGGAGAIRRSVHRQRKGGELGPQSGRWSLPRPWQVGRCCWAVPDKTGATAARPQRPA